MKSTPTLALALVALLGIGTGAAPAQEAAFDLELNALAEAGGGCRLTYVAKNGTGTGLAATSFEVAVFDKAGAVSRLLILEFGALPDGKTKVVQFDLAGQPCGDISRLLVNSVSECRATDGEAPDCLATLAPSSRTEVEFGL